MKSRCPSHAYKANRSRPQSFEMARRGAWIHIGLVALVAVGVSAADSGVEALMDRAETMSTLHVQLTDSVDGQQHDIRELRDSLYEIGVAIRNVRIQSERIIELAGDQEGVSEPLRQALVDSLNWMRAIRAQTDTLLGVQRRQSDTMALLNREMAALREEIDQLASVVAVGVPAVADSPIDSLIEEGERFLIQGLMEEAKDKYEEALALDPASIPAQLGLASYSFHMGQVELVAGIVDEVMARDETNAKALGLRGLLLWQDRNFAAARDALEAAIGLDPLNSQLHNYLGIIQHDLGEQGASLVSFRRSADLDPANPGALYNYAFALAKQPEPDLAAARDYYRASLQHGSPPDEQLERILFP